MSGLVSDVNRQCAGHTLSWGGGDASLLTPCYDKRGPTGAPGPLDPTRKHTYAVVGVLYFFSDTRVLATVRPCSSGVAQPKD